MAAAAYNLKKLMGAMRFWKAAAAAYAAKNALWKNWAIAQFIFGWRKFLIAM